MQLHKYTMTIEYGSTEPVPGDMSEQLATVKSHMISMVNQFGFEEFANEATIEYVGVVNEYMPEIDDLEDEAEYYTNDEVVFL